MKNKKLSKCLIITIVALMMLAVFVLAALFVTQSNNKLLASKTYVLHAGGGWH